MVNFRITPSAMIIKAGPPANAEAKNLGPSKEEFQKGLAMRPAFKKAVTRCMPKAQPTDRMTKGT